LAGTLRVLTGARSLAELTRKKTAVNGYEERMEVNGMQKSRYPDISMYSKPKGALT
jgi:hypothetical protein